MEYGPRERAKSVKTYRVKLNVHNIRQGFPSRLVTVIVRAYSPQDACTRVHTVYVSADGQTVNLTGGLGPGGAWYDEWEVTGVRLSRARPACQSTLSGTHSADRVTVYGGWPTPRVLCGFHASREHPPT